MSRMVQLPQPRKFGQTSRKDRWWLVPGLIFVGFSAFIVYSTWAALQGDHYFLNGQGQNYLSPFYSPVVFDAPGADSGHSWLGAWPLWWPGWLPATPALFILWAPGGFRFTCYYYRGAYYKAFWADPPSCSVGEPRSGYRGEQKFPLLIQNIHRYFLYVAIAFIGVLAYDAYSALWFTKDLAGKVYSDGGAHFGVGVGTVVLTLNAILLGCYTFGCHSLRHLIGGRKDSLSTAPLGKKTYDCVSCLNSRHMLWAWMSLFWVGFSDFYVRMCSMDVFTDLRIF